MPLNNHHAASAPGTGATGRSAAHSLRRSRRSTSHLAPCYRTAALAAAAAAASCPREGKVPESALMAPPHPLLPPPSRCVMQANRSADHDLELGPAMRVWQNRALRLYCGPCWVPEACCPCWVPEYCCGQGTGVPGSWAVAAPGVHTPTCRVSLCYLATAVMRHGPDRGPACACLLLRLRSAVS